MIDDEKVYASDIFFQDAPAGAAATPPPKQKPPRSRLGRAVSRATIGVLLFLLGLEVSGWYFQRESIARLQELGRSRADAQTLTPDLVRQHIAGWPLERSRTMYRRQMVVFTWPTLFEKRHVRMVLGQDGAVYTLDATNNAEDDVIKPFLYADSGGVKLPEYAARDAEDQPETTNKGLIAELHAAFQAPPKRLYAGVVVFPVTDDSNKVRDDGLALAMIANYSATYVPRRLLTTDPRRVLDTLLSANCCEPGAELDDKIVRICVRDLEPTYYVIPRVVTRADRHELKAALRRVEDDKQVATFEHELAVDELPQIPGLIALDVLEFQSAEISDAERETIRRAQFTTSDEICDLSYRMAGRTERNGKTIRTAVLTQNDSTCAAAWEYRLHAQRGSTHGGQPEAREVVDCAAIQRLLVPGKMYDGNTVAVFRNLLKLAPEQRADALYFRTLYNVMVKQDNDPLDDDVAEALFRVWEREDKSYGGNLHRGETLVEWAWKARGGGWASDVTSEGWKLFNERLHRAEREYERALAANPLGWLAHGGLIDTARGLGKPYDYVRMHRRQAAELCPDSWYAYQKEFEYLRKRWHGSAEQLLALARECLETRRWHAQIPQRVPQILFEVAFDYKNQALDYSWFGQPEYYSLVHDYYRYAQEQPDRAVRRDALNFAAIRLVGGGRCRDAAPLFDLLDRETEEPYTLTGRDRTVQTKTEYSEEHFSAGWNYFHLRDAAHAHAAEPVEHRLSALRTALADARLDDAERLLEAATPADDADSREIERCRKALALGRRLYADRQIEISAVELLDVCAEFHRLKCTPLATAPQWSAVDGKLVWNWNGYDSDPDGDHRGNFFFPVGLRHCTITAVMDTVGMQQLEVVAHSQSPRNRIHVYYNPGGVTITLVRTNCQVEYLNQARMNPMELRMQWGAQYDVIAPQRGTEWSAIVHDDLPGTFGITTFAGNGPAKLAISQLKISLAN
jgi:hypothetical protein